MTDVHACENCGNTTLTRYLHRDRMLCSFCLPEVHEHHRDAGRFLERAQEQAAFAGDDRSAFAIADCPICHYGLTLAGWAIPSDVPPRVTAVIHHRHDCPLRDAEDE